MQDFRNLLVWQKSHELVLQVYRASGDFPRDEIYGLTSQIRRAAVSIPSNIAEGCGRGSDAEFARFLIIAMGSSSELEYQLLLARDLGYIETGMHRSLDLLVAEVKRMLAGLIKRVQNVHPAKLEN
jgi:four helix bundle protein